MAADLIDYRGKITLETHCALTAEARALGVDMAEILRDAMHEWAMKRIHAASMLANCLRAKGLTGESEGISGGLQGVAGKPLKWDDA